MLKQKITVHTKGGLLAAFECAYDVTIPTEIILKRKTGITKFKLLLDTVYLWKNRNKSADEINRINLNKAKAKIRKIPAKELLL